MKRRGLDHTNLQLRLAVREMYRGIENGASNLAELKKNAENQGKSMQPAKKKKRKNTKGKGSKSPKKTKKKSTKAPKLTKNGKRVGRKPLIAICADDICHSSMAKTDPKSEQELAQPTSAEDINPDELSDQFPITKRRWKGEHWNNKTFKWELPEGKWWNPRSQAWEDGKPRLNYFYWYWEFIYDPTRYADPNPPGYCHEEWALQLESKTPRQMFLCPRDHFKTTFINVGYMVYHIVEFPDIAKMGILNISWDKGLAVSTFLEVKEALEWNFKILSFYGYMIDEDRKNTEQIIFFKYQPPGAKPGLKCTSFKSGSITGMHPYLVFLDDIEEEELSETYMTKFRRVLLNKLIPAVGKNGRVIVTGTVKGYSIDNDIYVLIQQNPLWDIHIYPAANKMPPMEEVEYETRYRNVIDPYTGKPVRDFDGSIKMEKFYWVQIKNRGQYHTLYPERYEIEDLVIKRVEIQKLGKSDDVFWSEYFLRAMNPMGRMFRKYRVGIMSDAEHKPPLGYASMADLIDYIHTHPDQHGIYLWIDPGGRGQTSHGMAISVCAKVLGKFYIFELLVLKSDLGIVAETIAELIIMYKIAGWGCEGNFDQESTYGWTLDKLVREALIARGRAELYTMINSQPNHANKEGRIKTIISNLLGFDKMPIVFWVNQDTADYEQFMNEFGAFPKLPKGATYQWDLLDSVSSNKLWMVEGAAGAVGAAA